MKPGRRSVNLRVPSLIAKPSVAVVVAALGLAAMACSASNVVEQPEQPATGPTVAPGASIVPPETNARGKTPQPALNGGSSGEGSPSSGRQDYATPDALSPLGNVAPTQAGPVEDQSLAQVSARGESMPPLNQASPSLSTTSPQPFPVTPVVAGATNNQGQFGLDDSGTGALHAAGTSDESVPSQQLEGNEVESKEGKVQGLNLPAKKQRKYPNLSTYLHQLVVDLEAGRTDAESADGDASPHGQDSQPVAVTIFLSGHVDEVVAFLEDNGGDPRNLGEDYIEAYVPVALLGQVSERPGVTRVREIIPPRHGPVPPVSIP